MIGTGLRHQCVSCRSERDVSHVDLRNHASRRRGSKVASSASTEGPHASAIEVISGAVVGVMVIINKVWRLVGVFS